MPVDICPEPEDGFSKFKQCLEVEKILHILHRTDFIFLS